MKQVSRVKNGQKREKNVFLQNCKFFKIQNFLFFRLTKWPKSLPATRLAGKIVVYLLFQNGVKYFKIDQLLQEIFVQMYLTCLCFLELTKSLLATRLIGKVSVYQKNHFFILSYAKEFLNCKIFGNIYKKILFCL